MNAGVLSTFLNEGQVKKFQRHSSGRWCWLLASAPALVRTEDGPPTTSFFFSCWSQITHPLHPIRSKDDILRWRSWSLAWSAIPAMQEMPQWRIISLIYPSLKFISSTMSLLFSRAATLFQFYSFRPQLPVILKPHIRSLRGHSSDSFIPVPRWTAATNLDVDAGTVYWTGSAGAKAVGEGAPTEALAHISEWMSALSISSVTRLIPI